MLNETDEAIERGYKNADDAWKNEALSVVQDLCLSQEHFTGDDVKIIMAKSDVDTHDKRAIGGVIRKAYKLGYCEPTGIYEQSQFNHGSLHQVWKSKLLKQNKEDENR